MRLAAQPVLRLCAVQLDARRNGLNLIRLLLAVTVLVAHGWYLSSHGVGPHLAGQNAGTWAVYGIFLISGYLITASRSGRGARRALFRWPELAERAQARPCLVEVRHDARGPRTQPASRPRR